MKKFLSFSNNFKETFVSSIEVLVIQIFFILFCLASSITVIKSLSKDS